MTGQESLRAPLRIAYADPPYPGMSHFYKDHPDYDGEVDHAQQPFTKGACDMREESHAARPKTYDEAEIATRGTPFTLASRPPGFVEPAKRRKWRSFFSTGGRWRYGS